MAVTISGASSRFEGSGLLIPDSKTYTASIWILQSELTASARPLLNFRNTGSALSTGISMSNSAVTLTGRNAAGTLVLSSVSSTTSPGQSTWRNLLVAVDLADATPTKLYIDGISQTMSDATIVDAAMEFSTEEVLVGASKNGADAIALAFIGTYDEIYFTTSYVDIDTEALRERFFGASKSKIGLGAGALTPTRETGFQPEIFLTHGPGNFGRNEGSAPDFDTVGSPTFTRGRPAAVETLSRGWRGEAWRESERSGIPFPESRLVIEPASGLEVAEREFSTDRDEINRRRRFGHSIFGD